MNINRKGKTDNCITRRNILKMAGGALALSALPSIGLESTAFAASKDKSMKIIMITGSPHKKGTSSLLADEFQAGVTSKGNAITRFDAAFENIAPCKGCYYCLSNNGECISKDAIGPLLDKVVEADMIVLVTPLYYFAMTAQIKMTMDRFMARRDVLRQHPMKSALLATCGSNTSWSMDALIAHYETLLKYLPWKDSGRILAKNVFARKDIEATQYPAEARALGESV